MLDLIEKGDASCKVPLVISSEPHMGVEALLDKIASDLEESGTSARRFSGDNWREANISPATVWLVGALESLPSELSATAEKAGARALVVGVESEVRAGSAKQFRLPHLGISDLKEMLSAIFGQHRFPDDFASCFWQVTLGYVDAVQETLNELLNRELIDVGLGGWEWFGSSTDLPISSPLLRLWQSRFEALTPPLQRALAVLALASGYALPLQAWQQLSGLHDSNNATGVNALSEQGWVEIGDSATLRSAVHASAIRASLSVSEAREVHGLLTTLGSSPAGEKP